MHNNGSAYTAADTLDHLEANRVQQVTRTLYSPSLASCDFFLFLEVKRQLKGKLFQGVENARAFFEDMISDIRQSTWSGAMVTWFQMMTKRLRAKGNSFEKLD